ncbi:hypothetical protein CPC08DRAFT_326183 [Agrocybe pediades]|nr:hypothetical protein CPC08DRAFT_326183 [Agrocybe pediades]
MGSRSQAFNKVAVIIGSAGHALILRLAARRRSLTSLCTHRIPHSFYIATPRFLPMMSYPDYEVHLPGTLEEGVEVDLETPSTQPPLPQHGRKRSRTMVDLDPTRLYVPGTSPSIHGMRNLRRSVSHMRLGRLQLSIPSAETPATPRSAESLESESETPQTAESSPELETPATRLASPIAGVVDLTKHITTTSAYAVAHGGLSDIYLGEWHRGDEDGIENPQGKAIVVVAIKLLRIFTAKDYDDVRSRKVNRDFQSVQILV